MADRTIDSSPDESQKVQCLEKNVLTVPNGIALAAAAMAPVIAVVLNAPEDWKAAKLAELPIGRFGEVREVAPTAVFLAPDDATYYVGQILGPNGGDVML